MANKSKIEHKGIIDDITNGSVFVKLETAAACSSCRAKTFCGADSDNEKIVEVKASTDGSYNIGDSVIVMMSEALGFKAVLYGYIAPFLVLFTSIATLLHFGVHEGLAAIFSLLLLAPYYGLLYLKKEKLKNEFKFNIRKNYQLSN